MAFKFNRSSKEPMSEINVTPFVDVMLVLLIIFMVTAPLLTVGVQVDLPESSADSLPEEQEPLTIGKSATSRDIADLIVARRSVAIYDGQPEAGPRALGHRSILFDPRQADPRGRMYSLGLQFNL